MRARVEDKMEILVGKLERDRLGWGDYAKVGGVFVKHWIWDALARLPAGKKVRITIEVLDD